MKTLLLNTFAMNGIVLWLGISLILALICIIGMIHQKERRLDWFLGFSLMAMQSGICLFFFAAKAIDLLRLISELPERGMEQLLADSVSLSLLLPVLYALMLAARRFAIARFRDEKTMADAGILAGTILGKAFMSFKEALASIRRMEHGREARDNG